MSKARIPAYSGAESYVFVSYAHRDSDKVYPVIEKLAKLGVNVWYDEGIPLVADYGSVLYNKLQNCTRVICFVSKTSVASPDVFKEISHASSFQRPIATVFLDNISVPPRLNSLLAPDRLSIRSNPKRKMLKDLLSFCSDCVNNGVTVKKLPLSVVQTLLTALFVLTVLVGVVYLASDQKNRFSEEYVDRTKIDAKYVMQENTGEITTFDSSRDYAPGESFYLGKYPELYEDDITELYYLIWTVMSEDDDYYVAMTDCVIDTIPYHNAPGDVTWETSYIRQWLNNDFYLTVFSEDEKDFIADSVISTPDNPTFGTPGGNSTVDKVYLLDIYAADELMNEGDRTKCVTSYAISRGNWFDGTFVTGSWWLRSPGSDATKAAHVCYNGYLDESGFDAYGENYFADAETSIPGVCPVIRIKKNA